MAITLIEGNCGSGKSYEAVAYYLLPSLEKGRKVVTNLPVNFKCLGMLNPLYPSLVEVLHRTPERGEPFSTIADYHDYQDWKHPDTGEGILFIIDEAHKALATGKATPRSVTEWFSMHRHSASDVLLVTQYRQKIHRHILTIVDDLIVVKKNLAFGSKHTYKRSVYDGATSRSEAVAPPVIRKYDKSIFPLYQSYTQGGIVEADFSGSKTVWSHPIFKVIILFGLFLGYHIGSNYIWGDKHVIPRLDESKLHTRGSLPSNVSNSVPSSSEVRSSDLPVPLPDSNSLSSNHPYKGYDARILGGIFINGAGVHRLAFRSPDGDIIHRTSDFLRSLGYDYKYDSNTDTAIASYGDSPDATIYLSYDPFPELPLSVRLERAEKEAKLKEFRDRGSRYTVMSSSPVASVLSPVTDNVPDSVLPDMGKSTTDKMLERSNKMKAGAAYYPIN